MYNGEMKEATGMEIIEPMVLSGHVAHGRGLGHRHGFPTANLCLDAGQTLPRAGVYASEAEIGGRLYAGITNVGTRPTADDSPEITVETWFPDLTADLYGQPLRLTLRAYLREIRRFADLDALKRQIDADCEVVRSVIRGA